MVIIIEKVLRIRGKTPYPPAVWMVKPIKATLILLGFGAGILWLVNGLLENPPLPPHITTKAAIVCIGALGTYCLYATISTYKDERFVQACRTARKKRLRELEAQGFSPTRRFIGSSRMFLVDEHLGAWCLFDYFNHPGQAELHKLSAILSATVAINQDWVARGHKILLSNGRRLNRKDQREYYGKKGVLLALNEKDCPYAFINCFKTENDVELITQYLHSLLEPQERSYEDQ